MKIKICSRCKLEKMSGEFHKNSQRNDGLHDECKFCRKRHYANNPEPYLERQGVIKTAKGYSLTFEEYLIMLENQNTRCAICQHTKKLVVDHCHNTGKVRGLLCTGCNIKLAFFEKNFNIITNYLK